MKRWVTGLFLVILLASCNLNNAPIDEGIAPTKTLIPSPTPDASSELSPITSTIAPLSSSSDDITNNTPQSSATLTICNPRTDWEVYVIQRGDNLSNIATRVDSTVDELITANCLDNPNLIRGGQEIYVPKLPNPTNTPLVTATP
jgi:LysM repeat protein